MNFAETITLLKQSYDLTEEELAALAIFDVADSAQYTPSLTTLTDALSAHPSDFLRKLHELKLFIARNPETIRAYQTLCQQVKSFEETPRNKRALLLQPLVEATKEIAPAISDISLLCIEFRSLSNALPTRLNEDMHWLRQSAINYFKPQLPDLQARDIEFFTKTDGDQLGQRMRISYMDADKHKKEIMYFIKTHQEGSRRNTSSTTPAHPEEIFMYKLLEFTGLGPKAHFFSHPLSTGAYFIATQDEAFTKQHNITKFFETYGKMTISSDQTMQDFVLQIDILMRLFYLWDILTNSGNYGKVSVEKGMVSKTKWRVIDFRVDTEQHAERGNIADEFLQGVQMQGYLGPLQAMTFDLTPTARLKSAQRIIDKLEHPKPGKLSMSEAIQQAFCFTVRLLAEQTKQQGLGIVRKNSLGELPRKNFLALTNSDIMRLVEENKAGTFGNYIRSVQKNYSILTESIKQTVCNDNICDHTLG